LCLQLLFVENEDACGKGDHAQKGGDGHGNKEFGSVACAVDQGASGGYSCGEIIAGQRDQGQ